MANDKPQETPTYEPYVPGIPKYVDEATHKDLQGHPFWEGLKEEADKRLAEFDQKKAAASAAKADREAAKAQAALVGPLPTDEGSAAAAAAPAEPAANT